MTPTPDDPPPSSTKPIHTRGALTVAEVVSATRLAPSVGRKVTLCLFWIFVTIMIVYSHGVALLIFYREGLPAAGFVLAMALLLDFMVAFQGLRIWRFHRTLRGLHRERRFLFQEATGRIDEIDFRSRSDDAEHSVAWAQFVGYRANEMVVVVYQLYPTNYAVLGRSKFASDADWLRAVALVAEKLPHM